jgi:3-oxoacyl-[acyl-carrier protein] reductase
LTQGKHRRQYKSVTSGAEAMDGTQDRKVAIVTGGARGIGRGIALKLAASGCAVVLVDVLEPEMASTRAEVEAMGAPCLSYPADVADHGRARAVAAAVLDAWGRIDILVNNAGRAQPKGILEITEAEWDATIDVNLKSCFNWVQATGPALMASGSGRIVSISSLNALSGGVTAAVSKFAYAAAKAGILGMTRALAKEMGPTVLVNAICPGLIKTEIAKNRVIAEREPELVKGIAQKRVGTPQDVAELVAFLALSDPCFVTGQAITVDGFQWNM